MEYLRHTTSNVLGQWTLERLRNKKTLINMKSKDDIGFKWAVTRALNPTDNHPERVTKILREQSNQYDWRDIDFPTTLDSIETFERNNDLLINVFGFDDEEGCVRPLRVPKGVYAGRVSLMLIDGRYAVIKCMSRLLKGQATRRNCKRFYCNNCLDGFASEERLQNHVPSTCVDFEAKKLTTDQSVKETSERLCSLCSMHGEDECAFHLEMEGLDSPSAEWVKKLREDILDPNRRRDIFVYHNEEECYKAIYTEGVWTLFYLGLKRDVRIIDVNVDSEEATLVFGKACRSSATLFLPRVRRVCIACFTYGREGCLEHMFADTCF